MHISCYYKVRHLSKASYPVSLKWNSTGSLLVDPLPMVPSCRILALYFPHAEQIGDNMLDSVGGRCIGVMTAIIAIAMSVHAQSAPSLNLTSPVNIGSNPQTSTGMGMSSAVFNGTLYVAFKANNGPSLWIETSTDGVTFTDPGAHYTNIQSNYAPSLIVFGAKLYLAYTTTSGGISIVSSSDGVNFSSATSVFVPSGVGNSVSVTSPPTLVVYNGILYAYWESDYTDPGTGANANIVGGIGSADGTDFYLSAPFCTISSSQNIGTYRPRSQARVGAATFAPSGNAGEELVVAIQAADPSDASTNELLVCQDGSFNTYSDIKPGSGIAAAVFNGSLYLAFKYNHSDNELELTGTEDGNTFTDPVVSYNGIRIFGSNEVAPSMTVFNNVLYVFNAANNKNVQMEHSY